MGIKSRRKGLRIEREIVRILQDHGLAGERVPLSGAAHGRFGGDVSVPVLGIDRRIEVKARATGFAEIYKWIDGADFLIIKRDRAEPLMVLRLSEAMKIVAVAEKGRFV